MRKYIRNIIRHEAKKEKNKPSRHVKVVFDEIQQKKYGINCRKRNKARGTHKAKVWYTRVALSYSN